MEYDMNAKLWTITGSMQGRDEEGEESGLPMDPDLVAVLMTRLEAIAEEYKVQLEMRFWIEDEANPIDLTDPAAGYISLIDSPADRDALLKAAAAQNGVEWGFSGSIDMEDGGVVPDEVTRAMLLEIEMFPEEFDVLLGAEFAPDNEFDASDIEALAKRRTEIDRQKAVRQSNLN